MYTDVLRFSEIELGKMYRRGYGPNLFGIAKLVMSTRREQWDCGALGVDGDRIPYSSEC